MVKKLLGIFLLFGLISANFYPYPFNYGLKAGDITFMHKQIVFQNMTIADNVHEIYYDSHGYISGLLIEKGMELRRINFLRDNGSMDIKLLNSTVEWQKKANNQDDKKLAISVEQTVNNNLGLEVCKAENQGAYWDVRALYNKTYDWIIERSLFAHNPLFNGANWAYEGNEVWKIYKVG